MRNVQLMKSIAKQGQCGTSNLKEAQSHLKTYAERRQSALGEGSSVTRVPSSSTVHAL